jgi:hypothetical protein
VPVPKWSAVAPLIQTASDFPSLYILPVHLARTLNTLNGGSKDEILASNSEQKFQN